MASSSDYLVKVTGGYFASDAWMKGDKEYFDVAGTKFGGVFGDDGKKAHCDKCHIRRLQSDEEFEKLYESACPEFKFVMKCLDEFERIRKEHTDLQSQINFYQAKAKFLMETCILKPMLEKFPDLTPEQYVKMYIK